MQKRYREFIVLLLVFFSFFFVFYGVSFLIINNTSDNKPNKVKQVKVDKPVKVVEEEVVEPYVNNLPTFRANYGNNNIMGIIEIPGVINEALIARSGDNDYYLDRNLWNQYDGIGAPFFDYRNTDLDNNKQINIYGHNSQNNNILDRLPLAKLTNYLDPNFFNTYRDVYLYTDNKKMHYEVIGAKIIDKSDNSHMTINFYDDDDFITHITNLLNGSYNIKKDAVIKKDDRILVFQTCYYNPPNSMVIIICKSV